MWVRQLGLGSEPLHTPILEPAVPIARPADFPADRRAHGGDGICETCY